MKRITLFLIISGFLLPGCRKQYECSQPINYIVPISMVFGGYAANELTEIIINRYQGGTDFSELISRDTIRSSQIILKDSLAFLKVDTEIYSGFWNLEDQVDYRVTVPATQNHYVISGTRKGPAERTWVQEYPCDVKAGTYSTMQDTHVDGMLVYPVPGINLKDISFSNYYIALKK